MAQRVLAVLGVACAALALTGARANAQTATPPPVVTQSQGQMGYYMMQGSRIINAQPYPSAPACFKAVAELMKQLPANTPTIVCAHRRP